MTFTLAITVYNRYELLLESFAEVVNDPRIDEILIVDDCSKASYWNRIRDLDKFNPKIRVIRQAENRGMMMNKRDAIGYAKNEWVIIFDSDNIIKPDYLDAIPGELFKPFIYAPDFAWPSFDYRKFDGQEITAVNAAEFVADPVGNMCLNTCNYLVNRDEYLKAYVHWPHMKGTDTIAFAYHWLKAGNAFYITPGMTYFHRVHKESGFMEHAAYNMKRAAEIKTLIERL